MIDTRETLEALRKARDLVAQGWTQHSWFEGPASSGTINGCFCTMGAVAAVSIPHVDFECFDPMGQLDGIAQILAPHAEAVEDHWSYDLKNNAGALSRIKWSDIAKWNDAEGRTQDQVVKMFDLAIAELHLSLPHLEGQAS